MASLSHLLSLVGRELAPGLAPAIGAERRPQRHQRVHVRPAGAMVQNYREIFDFLYAEGGRGYPVAHDSLIHAHIGGRALAAGAWEQTMQYAKSHSDVWFCSKGDLAAWHEQIRSELADATPYAPTLPDSSRTRLAGVAGVA